MCDAAATGSQRYQTDGGALSACREAEIESPPVHCDRTRRSLTHSERETDMRKHYNQHPHGTRPARTSVRLRWKPRTTDGQSYPVTTR